MIDRLLIADLDETAIRVIRACRKFGIEALAAQARSDAVSMAVELEDRAACIERAGIAATANADPGRPVLTKIWF